jgi:hypothetical protein
MPHGVQVRQEFSGEERMNTDQHGGLLEVDVRGV